MGWSPAEARAVWRVFFLTASRGSSTHATILHLTPQRLAECLWGGLPGVPTLLLGHSQLMTSEFRDVEGK